MIENHRAVIKKIITNLFMAEDRRLAKVIEEINKLNSEAYGEQSYGFLYNGNFYLPATVSSAGRGHRGMLHMSLNDKMEAHLRDVKQIELDKDQIGQMVFKLTYQCTTLQELRDALPDCLTDTVPELKSLRRYMIEGWTVRNDWRALAQFKKLLPKMQMYSVSRLIY